jgi:hypothetical protein
MSKKYRLNHAGASLPHPSPSNLPPSLPINLRRVHLGRLPPYTACWPPVLVAAWVDRPSLSLHRSWAAYRPPSLVAAAELISGTSARACPVLPPTGALPW